MERNRDAELGRAITSGAFLHRGCSSSFLKAVFPCLSAVFVGGVHVAAHWRMMCCIMANGLTYARKTASTEATKQLAETLAPYLHPGDVVVLSGDLGAGKTQFVQGVAAGLGISAQVTSPTFNILLEYHQGRIPLYHFDLYRLDEQDELEDTGDGGLTKGLGRADLDEARDVDAAADDVVA